jgi:DNA uptake protein ComE-like DNA-binding protein
VSRHQERKADKAFQTWHQERDDAAELLNIAQHFEGEDTSDLLLAPDEKLFLCVTNTALIEERRGQGHYEGRSSGVSIPIGTIGGRSIRYRVGASRGHYVQGTPTPTAIDRGNTYITNKRVVFRGSSQTRECLFTKLIGFEHNPAGSTTFSVSNRQKATVISYGAQASGVFSFRLDLAIAHYRHTLSDFIAGLQRTVDDLDAHQPPPPSTPSSVSSPEQRSSRTHSRWPYLSLIPLGFGAWAPIYAGVKARQGAWISLGVLWSGLILAGLILSNTTRSAGSGNSVAGLLLIVGWVGAIATSFVIRGSYDRRMASPLHAATEAGEARLQDRRQAQLTARENPSLAREIGVGRPDEPGAFDAGLVDVNNAPASALAHLPEIDDRLATRIVEVRAQTDGFSSLEDLGTVLDLPGELVERLRDHVVFLPR